LVSSHLSSFTNLFGPDQKKSRLPLNAPEGTGDIAMGDLAKITPVIGRL
jgi:hypothetical protein